MLFLKAPEQSTLFHVQIVTELRVICTRMEKANCQPPCGLIPTAHKRSIFQTLRLYYTMLHIHVTIITAVKMWQVE